jgi:hypothetical protein
MDSDFPQLPCFPCPHHSACCAFGTTVTAAEAAGLSTEYGEDKVYRTRWGEWRTRVRGGRCVFLVENACTIHQDPHFPAVCHAFPWIDAETGGAYQFDQAICPEFVTRPELVTIGKVKTINGRTVER